MQAKLPSIVLVERGLSLLCAKLTAEPDGADPAASRPPLAKVSTGTVDFGHYRDHANGCDCPISRPPPQRAQPLAAVCRSGRGFRGVSRARPQGRIP